MPKKRSLEPKFKVDDLVFILQDLNLYAWDFITFDKVIRVKKNGQGYRYKIENQREKNCSKTHKWYKETYTSWVDEDKLCPKSDYKKQCIIHDINAAKKSLDVRLDTIKDYRKHIQDERKGITETKKRIAKLRQILKEMGKKQLPKPEKVDR